MNAFLNFLKNAKKIAIITHQNADPDAVGSATAIEFLINTISPQIETILIADSLSSLSKNIISKFYPEKTFFHTLPDDVDHIIITDTNNKEQLGNISFEDTIPIFIIDHHADRIDKLSDFAIIRSDYTSACEIITEILREMKISPSIQVANLLLTGILYDTRRFLYSHPSTMNNVLWLINAGATFSDCVKSLQVAMSYSERVARIKSAIRAEYLRIRKWIIVISHVRSFEASACRGLIDLGADIAIVISERKGKVRVSARSTEDFFKRTGFHLGSDLMEPLGNKINGSGGGHAMAAGANGYGTTEEVKSIIKKLISKIK